MKWGLIHFSKCLFAVVCVSACLSAQAAPTSRVAGTYQVLRQAAAAGQIHMRMQLHLINRGGTDLRIQRITLWDFSHPTRGGTQLCSLVIPAASSSDTTQEFTIPRTEYELWRRGAQPRLVLEVAAPGGRSSSEVVSLERADRRKEH